MINLRTEQPILLARRSSTKCRRSFPAHFDEDLDLSLQAVVSSSIARFIHDLLKRGTSHQSHPMTQAGQGKARHNAYLDCHWCTRLLVLALLHHRETCGPRRKETQLAK